MKWYLETRPQFFHHCKWSRRDVTHGEAFQVDQHGHASNEQLFILVTHHLRDHEIYFVDLLELFGFSKRLKEYIFVSSLLKGP